MNGFSITTPSIVRTALAGLVAICKWIEGACLAVVVAEPWGEFVSVTLLTAEGVVTTTGG